jgi:DNA primase
MEIHPFLARVPDIERPDFMVFDLDPGEGIDILGSARVALLLKRALDRHNRWSVFKTTISVYPLREKSDTPVVSRPLTWEELGKARRPASLQFEPLKRLESGRPLRAGTSAEAAFARFLRPLY